MHQESANSGCNNGHSSDWKHHFEKAYRHLPVWAQNIGVTLYGIPYRRERLGGAFEKYVAEFRARDCWPKEQMQAFLEQQLHTVLLHAYLEVPYYSQKWTAAGLDRTQIERITPSELSRIPITSKLDLVRDAASFVARDIAATNKVQHYYTSGSTGSPVTSFLIAEDHQRSIAAREVRSFGWAETSVRWPRAMIGGRMVVPRADSPPPYYRYNWAERQVYFSAFHISPRSVRSYLEGFHRHRPRVFTGYAHSYYTLARMMLEEGLQLEYEPAALVLGSEKLTAEMKHVIQQAFHARAYEEYGNVEQCALATECEAGSLHVSSDFGIVEILDEKDMTVPPGAAGRIVCTGLANRTQPLIRYDIGDIGVWSDRRCPCGRDQLPVLEEVIGRVEDVVIGSDGRQMVRFHGIFINLPHVVEGQVIQEQLDFVRVRVVTRPGFGAKEEQLIRARFQERLGRIGIQIERVNEIERTGRGKFRAVISQLPAGVRSPVCVNSFA
jgi:phenylacetate-CoA ligase